MITLIFGGLYQGQEEYLETHYSENDAVIFPAEQYFEGLVLEDLERMIHEHKGNLVFAGREIGSGVVPIDPKARAYRDHVGRCYQIIAKHADRVIRVSMGVAEVLK